MRSAAIVTLVLALAAGAAGCKEARKPVTVFAAASLTRALAELEQTFEESQPKLELRLEISGSQTACRKVAELGRPADLVASADYRVIERILRPTHAGAVVRFATNAVTLVHLEHSRHTAEITSENWAEVLQRPGVRLGLVDPDLGPIGYRTLLVWKLAGGEALAKKLRARVKPEHLAPHEAELMQLLQARAIDYAFVYQSTAEEQNLKTVDLGAAVNLSDPAREAAYARAEVAVQMSSREQPRRVKGAPVTYGLTIPKQAPNPQGADAFLQLLLSEEGQRTLERTGFRPLSPAHCAPCEGLPPAVRVLTKPL